MATCHVVGFSRIILCLSLVFGCNIILADQLSNNQVLRQKTVISGKLFNISASGTPANFSITLCLNAKGPLSCQNYNVSALNLSISPTITEHTYPNAGIKINTSGYSPTNCVMNENGFCIFSVSSTAAKTISVQPPTCPADVISFSPSVTRLNNPTGGSPNSSQQFTINMTICDSKGKLLTPSVDNPVHVDVYGAPDGLITPTSTTTSTGTVTFTYSGGSFPNNISINAWISDSSNHGAALGVTPVLKQNSVACTYGSTSYQVPLVGTLPNALQLKADVGYDKDSSSDSFKSFTIDTGSLGVIVPKSELPDNANVIGPGAVGVKYYDSSGNTYSGNYYLSPVRLQLSSGAVETYPILVLGIDKAYCTGPKTKQCHTHPPEPNLHYMGVGFNRNSSTTDDLFDSPTANAFLHITNADNGTDVSPGYYLTPGDNSAATGLTLGITHVNDYNVVNLTANSLVPGDFNAQAGCFSFPDSPLPNQFCGTALLDVGIDYMFIDLPKAQWPAGTFDSNNEVPHGTNMSILMGDTNSPAMMYNFSAVQSNPPSDTPTPARVQWIDSTESGQIFVNTGRRPLYKFNYFYAGQCGQVGFKALS